jgi:hypothetical protein
VSDRSYQSTVNKQTFGLGKGSTTASDIWCIIRGILMYTVAPYFIGIIIVSVSSKIQHKCVGEGLIDDTGLAYSTQSSTEISSTTLKDFSPDESILFDKMQKILQFFLRTASSRRWRSHHLQMRMRMLHSVPQMVWWSSYPYQNKSILW